MKSPRPQNNPWSSNGYRSNDLVRLCGGVDNGSQAFLEVNGLSLPLNRRQFLVMLALVCHSLAISGATPPMTTPPHPFLSADMILSSIEKFLDCFTPRPNVYNNHPVAQDVIRVVKQIRDALNAERLNSQLVLQGPRKRGYRLGTPPHNVVLIFIKPAGSGTIRISGAL